MTYAQTIRCKLYLEGIEFPFSSVNIIEQKNSPVQATFSVKAHPKIPFLLPKTLAHLFYFIEGKYRLIFEGELANVDFSKTRESRDVKLTFIGISHNWASVYMKSLDFVVGNFAGAHFYGIASKLDARQKNEETISKITGPPLSEDYWKTNISNNSWYFSTDYIAANLVLVFKRALKENNNSLQETVLSLLNYLSEQNLYYPVIVNALKINSRVKVFNNTEANKFLTKQAWVGFLTNELGGLPQLSNFITILNYILKFLVYDWTELAAPVFDSDNKIRSLILKPQTDYFLPIRCNVIYPDQVTDLRFYRNFVGEPTRMQFEPSELLLKVSETTGMKALFSYYAPYTEIIKVSGLPKINLTSEEKYRGMQPGFGEAPTLAERAYLGMFQDVDSEHPEKEGKITNPPKAAVTNKLNGHDVTKFLSEWLDYQFCHQRFSSRQCSLITSYSPFRLVGFPALIFDNVLPSVVGTIESINSAIDANGQGTQSIVISRPRLYLDSEISADFDPSEDSAPHFPYFFDSTYEATSIGSEHYKTIINNSEQEIQDGSVWAYVSDDEASSLNSRLNSDDLSQANKEALRLGQAILSLKKQYGRFSEDRHRFINQQTKRRLVTEEEWWSFLNIYKDDNGNYDPSNSSNYRVAANLEVGEQKQENGSFIAVTSGYKPSDVKVPFVKERADKIKEVLN